MYKFVDLYIDPFSVIQYTATATVRSPLLESTNNYRLLHTYLLSGSINQHIQVNKKYHKIDTVQYTFSIRRLGTDCNN